MNTPAKGNMLAVGLLAAAVVVVIGTWWIAHTRTVPRAEGVPVTSPTEEPEVTPTSSLSEDSSFLWGVFAGTLPCGDCQGIATTLMLYSGGVNIDYGTFELTEEYTGKEGQSVTSKGDWTTLRGMPEIKNATVVELTVQPNDEKRYFWRVSQDSLQMLNKDQKRIQPYLHYLLTRRGDLQPTGTPEATSSPE